MNGVCLALQKILQLVMAICMHFGLICQNWTSGLHYWQTRGGSTLPKVAWLEAGPLWANSAYMDQLL